METPAPKRRRARKPDGQYKADNPDTVTNEAWLPVEAVDALVDKPVGKYDVKPRIIGTSDDTAGKYSKKPKVRPTFGGVTTTFN